MCFVTIDGRLLRNSLGHFATGVTVVTYEIDGEQLGLTLNAFTAVSLDPPLILVSLDRRSNASKNLEGRPFVVNILSGAQLQHAMNFAGKPQQDCIIDWHDCTPGQPPRLAGCAGYFECAPWHSYDGGDHILHLGEVKDFGVAPDVEPLLFYGGKFRTVGGYADDVLQAT